MGYTVSGCQYAIFTGRIQLQSDNHTTLGATRYSNTGLERPRQ